MQNKKSKHPKRKILTKMNLSKEEIRALNYKRFQHPCSKIQKRLHTLYLKAACNFSITEIAGILAIHPNSVASYIKMYQEKGEEGLCFTGYHNSGSELETY
jgi:hypothetical protein